MKTQILQFFAIIFCSAAIIVACTSGNAKNSDDYLPLDVLPSCVVSEQEFNAWFTSGTASANGAVNPANSVTFGHENNCDFYKWSQQMFLWITSPNQGAGGRVFESPVFYTVSPEDSDGKRNLIKHASGQLLSAMPTLEKSSDLESEEGQATGDVLMSKDKALVYYITMVNDVYAHFLTAVKNGKMAGNRFPTTQAALDSIIAIAGPGARIPDPEALAIEIKSSWVDAKSVANPSDYITIDAIIPTYKKTDKNWVINGQTKARLALLGMHIVGSTAGHPEMIWSTFEHKNTAPNLGYCYLDKNNKVKTVPADNSGNWVLNSNPKDTVINQSHMKFTNNTITAEFQGAPAGNTISPSNSARTKPWGVANAGVPNQEDKSVAAANSQVISINNSVMLMLKAGDIRKNYMFIGSTWTEGGAAPDGSSYSATNTKPGTAIGSSQLANTTMETYIQNGETYNQRGSCFLCHHQKTTPSLSPGYLSHVFGDLRPLSNSPTADINNYKAQ